MISFFVPGTPVPKGRPRATIVGKDEIAMSKYGAYIRRGARPRLYTPKTTIMGQDAVKNAYLEKYRPDPAIGPLWIEIIAFIKPPASTSKAKREAMFAGEIYPTGRPDIDNLLKLAMDALEGLAYKNDSQIVAGYPKKKYGPREGVEIKIERMNVIGGNK